MYRLLSLLFILNLFGSCLFAQERPLPIEQVRPLIDSVQIEINRLYRLSESIKKAEKLYAKNFESTFSYQRKDTTIVLGLDENKLVLSTYYFLGEEIRLISKDESKRALTEEEDQLILAKKAALQEAKKKHYAIQAPEECAMEYIFYPNRSGYTLYAIAIPLVDSILPLGSDHYFLFDYEMKVVKHSQTKTHRVHSIRKKDNPRSSTLGGLSAPLRKNNKDFKDLIPYFYKYRVYYQNLGLIEYGAAINKRSLTYNAVKNEISIKLFPVEKK